jgi:glycosyltransferase involved in cell wall biosynthesis
VRHGHNGWLYRPGDVLELSSRLASLLVDPALRRRMGAAGRDIVSDHEFDATLDAFEGVYTRVLGRAEPAVGRAA